MKIEVSDPEGIKLLSSIDINFLNCNNIPRNFDVYLSLTFSRFDDWPMSCATASLALHYHSWNLAQTRDVEVGINLQFRANFKRLKQISFSCIHIILRTSNITSNWTWQWRTCVCEVRRCLWCSVTIAVTKLTMWSGAPSITPAAGTSKIYLLRDLYNTELKQPLYLYR